VPSSGDIRRRIRSIGATAQITKAMQMVAASKMRKAQQAAIEARPFVQLAYRIQRFAATHAEDFTHRLLDVRPVRRRAVILVASDKGLCGALNANVFRLVTPYDPASTVFIAAGRKAAQFIARTRRQLVAEFPYGDAPHFSESRAIAALARDIFLKGDVDEVRLVATRFVSTTVLQPLSIELLPLSDIGEIQVPDAPPLAPLADAKLKLLFEPNANDLIGQLLPMFLNIFVHVVLLNAKASEQSARMVSMSGATESAARMIHDLTLEYNKLRQGRITQELLEIAGGQAG
jgi:F-type H+-transporting ATPase subunit gamma